MNNKFASFVFSIRGIYMFIALAVAMIVKSYQGGVTPLQIFITSVIILVLAQFYRTYAASHLWGKQAVTKIQANFLCTSGPYAHVRNPFYVGNFLIGMGLSLAIFEWYAFVLFIISYIFIYSVVIPYEEEYLKRKFGNVYLRYKAHVPRLIPRFTGFNGGTRIIPHYLAGILGEIHVPIFLTIFLLVIYRLFVR